MKQSSREKLLQTAVRLFAEYGYDGVSIRRIAAESGVNSALISYHFKGKEGLYQAVIEAHIHFIAEFLESVRTRRMAPREIVRAYGRAMLCVHQASPHFVRIFYREQLNASPVLPEMIRRMIGPLFLELRGALEEGVREGSFRSDLDVEKAVLALAGCINFYFITRPVNSRFLPQDEAFAEAYLDQALDIFLSGIERRD